MTRKVLIAITSLAVVFALAPSASASNYLEIFFDRMDIDGGGFEYRVIFVANKDGATTASLTTPLGTYACEPFGGGWIPEQAGSYWTDHFDLDWTAFSALIAGDWTLVWDQGLGTQTVAHIVYGPIVEAEFLPLPTIIFPVDGTIYDPDSVVEVLWNYGPMDPCVAQQDIVEICVIDVAFEPECQELDSCDLTSIYLDVAYPYGDHAIEVRNIADDVRLTADGIGGPVTGDPWILENTGWLAFQTNALTRFTGAIVDSDATSLGDLKARFR